MRRIAVGLACVIAEWAAGQCPPNGLVLTATGGRLGDPFSLTISGTPNVGGLLGFDLAPGPVPTPIGNVCLGLTPALQLQAFGTDFTGNYGFGGIVPPSAGLAGLTVFMQAAAADATQPSGYAVSNGASATIRSPHLYLVQPTQPSRFIRYDVVTDSFLGVVFLPAMVKGQAAVSALGWLALLLSNDTIMTFDGASGANTLTFNVPPPTGYWASLTVAGTTLLAFDYGTTTVPGSLRAYSLPAGSFLWSTPLPPGALGPVVPSGSGTAYMVIGSSFLPINLATGVTLPMITMGPASSQISEYATGNGFIYCILGQAGFPQALNGVDTTSQTALFPTPVPATGAITNLRFGPGSVGPSLFVLDWGAGALVQLSPTTLAQTAPPVYLPSGFAAIEPTGGGTEWLILTYNPPGCTFGLCDNLYVLNVATLALTLFSPVVGNPFGLMGAVPSATLTKAYATFYNGTPVLLRINTDPTTSVSSVPIPNMVLYYSSKILID